MAYDTPDDWEIVRRAHVARARTRSRASKPRCARAWRAASSRRGARRSRARSRPTTWGGDAPVLPQRRRPASRRRRASRDAAEAATAAYARARRVPPRRVRAARRPTRPGRPRALRAVRARVQRHRARPRRDVRVGLGGALPHRGRDAARSASASSPARRSPTVDRAPRDDPTRTIDGVDEFQRWNQDLIDTTIAELDGTHFDIPAPVHRCEAMIAPPGGAAAMYYTGPSEDFSRPGRTWYPTLGKTTLPALGRGVDLLPRRRPRPSPAGRAGALPRRHAVPLPAHARLRVGPRRRLGAVRRAADGRARLPRRPRVRARHARARRRCARCASIVDIGMHLELPIPAHERYHPGETWTPELALPFVIERSCVPRRLHAQRGRPLPRLARPGDQLQGRRAGVARGPRRRASAATAPPST